MNIAALIGDVASEPKLITTTNGSSICTFKIAIRDDKGTFTIVTFNKQAEICDTYT